MIQIIFLTFQCNNILSLLSDGNYSKFELKVWEDFTFNSDRWLSVGVSGYWLEHHFSSLGADGKAE